MSTQPGRASDGVIPQHGSTFRYGAHVRANGIRQHYLRYGIEGTRQKALVVVPGIVSPAAVWGFVGERLGRVFDTYVLDVRGRGLSQSGPGLDYGLDACAADLRAFVEALGIQGAIVFGHSMGARIAIRAAREAGASFARLVLADPPVSGPGRRAYPSPLSAVLELMRAARLGEAEAALRRPGVAPWPEPLLRVRAEWLHTCDERAAIEAHRSFHADDIHADLPYVVIPMALIVADKGGVILPQDIAEIQGLAPQIDVRKVEGAGHQMQVDNLEGFLAILGSILERKL
ncbi:MAG: alpha/beta hydrolase [Betaproteobacteria bacterium]|nr:alpha/beta hydrolase [Betaproteobacteria bacterium]